MENKKILQILLGEFHQKLDLLKNLTIRDKKFPNAPNKIKVAIGMRRVGKTYFLYQTILKMIHEGLDRTRILYINFEDDRLFPLSQHLLGKLVESFYSLYPENHEKKCCLFFDEIQNVPNWHTVIRRLYDSKNVEIFLTGSSAKLLSKEIATSLRGRSLAIEIWPYSFNEFIKAKKYPVDRSLYDQKTKDNLEKLFQQYLATGGFPEVIDYEPDVRQSTLQEYIDIVIYRDILERYNIKNPVLIKYFIHSLLNNVGAPFSINKFYNDLKSQGFQIGRDLLYEYMDHIEDTFLAFSLGLHSRSIRKVQVNPKKIYGIDTGVIRSTTLDYESNLGRLFENVIFLDLKRLGYDLSYYLTSERFEIDFLVRTSQGKKKLFQVVWEMENEKTLEREQRALEAAMKELKTDGEIITLESYLKDGIKL